MVQENKSRVLILDFGSQFTQLIARRIRELQVFCEIKPCNTPLVDSPEALLTQKYNAIILSGGPSSVTDSDAPAFDPRWLDLKIPILGVCYGMQLIAHLKGGRIGTSKHREYGHADIRVENSDGIFSEFQPNSTTTVWMSHGDHVDSPPVGFDILARSTDGVIAAIGNPQSKQYAVQFHPEVHHSIDGTKILASFLFNVSSCVPDWTAGSFIEREISRIKELIPLNSNVICGLSGGVDSTVAATLVHRAIGDRLHCIFVDNGLLRADEADEVMAKLGTKGLGLNIHRIDGSRRFLDALSGISNPEEKRKIIGRIFIELFEEEAHRIKNVDYLVQGTLYPDVIESVSVRGPSVTIKTHHNVGGLPERMRLKLLEPLRELFKDEVRQIGRELNIPSNLIARHPFPGPGLAVRILGDITEEKLEILRRADKIFIEELHNFKVYDSVWQAFAVLLPVQSVGVMGDSRTYERVIALRAVHSRDGMTADWAYLPHELLRRVSTRIINEVRGINRVVYDVSSKPPSTIEWE